MENKAFNTQQEIELLQGAYEEAVVIRDLAWERVSTAMLAACPIKVGDMVERPNRRSGAAVRRVVEMFLNRTNNYRGGWDWEIRAKLRKVKKDGGTSLNGEDIIWDVERELREGALRLVPEIINTK
jgi:hypothetical protein